jgi:hypothetical protein
MEKYKDEEDYVKHFWENCTPAVRTNSTRIYIVQGEAVDFPELEGRNQVCIQECQSGHIMELV